MLELTVQVAETYPAGFPMLASITLSNQSIGTTFQHLPEGDLLDDELPLDLFDADGRALIVATHACSEGAPMGRVLGPGDRVRFTVDLAARWTPAVGDHEVTAQWPGQPGTRTAPLRITVVEASDAARESSARLRGTDPWAWWVLDGGDPIEPEDLDALSSSSQHIELHRFVRASVHGDAPIAELDVECLLALEGPAAAEGCLLRHEVLSARGEAMAPGLGAAIAERWPGCAERLAENTSGDGWLAQLRATHGPMD